MATATRWTMRQEPYDPDARDADGDGIVQEQTPWERPAGTRLVDELGRAITRGANASQRPRGLRVVGPRGNTVSYTPTYERPGGGFGGGGTPLGEAGAPSLRERGLPSVRDITAPPTQQVAPEAPVSPVQASETPEPPKAPEVFAPSVQEMTEASAVSKSIEKSVEAEFGPITNAQEARDALHRAFPTASGNVEALLNSAGGPWDDNTSRVKAVRNYTIGLLHMAQQDPKTAARITRLSGLDTQDPNAGGIHRTRYLQDLGQFQSWELHMNPRLNVNELDREARQGKGEPWAYTLAWSMKESGQFSDDDINQILQHSVAIHEFAHAMHLSAGLSYWGADRGGVVPAEPMILALAKTKGISVSDASDEINKVIQESGFDKGNTPDRAIVRAIDKIVAEQKLEEFIPTLSGVIHWDGIPDDQDERTKIREDLAKASGYAGHELTSNPAAQYKEGVAETIARSIGSGTPASGGEEMLAHVQSVFPGSETKTQDTKEKIEKKNAEILGKIEEQGGTFARVDEDFIERDKEYGEARGLAASLFQPKTPKEAAARRREVAKQHLEAFQHVLRTGKAPTEEDGFLPWQVRAYENADGILSIYGRMSDDLLAHVRDTDPDELIDEIEQEALKFHEGISSPRVRIPTSRVDAILESGTYRTTHEVESSHSGEGFRKAYERSLGIPSDATPDVRPASGYVTHPDATEEAKRLFREREGREPTEFDQLDQLDGTVDIYGHIELTLDPTIGGRTAYGRSDSLNNATRAARIDSSDKDEITNAILGVGGKEANQVDPIAVLLNWQEARRTGSYGRVTDKFGWREEKSDAIVGIHYTEALIAGSFDLDEVAEVKIYPEARNPMGLENSTTPVLGYVNGAALKDGIHDEFYGTEALKRSGLTDEEIQYLQNNGLLKLDGQLKYHLGGDALMGLLEYRKAKELQDGFEAAGIRKVVHIHPSGLDMMNPESYGGDADLGGTAEAIRIARVKRGIVRDAREQIERHKSRPASRPGTGPKV